MKLMTLAMSVMLAGTGLLRAGEHPHEHPSGSGHEHPSKTGKTSSASSVTMEDLAKAITDYVQKDSALKGGHFLLYDPVAKKALPLTLDKVHKDRLSKVSDDTYFACADFKTPEGKAYDLDVFMKGADAASLQATEVSIHKEDGKARYGWVEEKGIWKKK